MNILKNVGAFALGVLIGIVLTGGLASVLMKIHAEPTTSHAAMGHNK